MMTSVLHSKLLCHYLINNHLWLSGGGSRVGIFLLAHPLLSNTFISSANKNVILDLSDTFVGY